jgi:hypothetical protein
MELIPSLKVISLCPSTIQSRCTGAVRIKLQVFQTPAVWEGCIKLQMRLRMCEALSPFPCTLSWLGGEGQLLYIKDFLMGIKAGLRHVGTPGKVLICHPFKLIFVINLINICLVGVGRNWFSINCEPLLYTQSKVFITRTELNMWKPELIGTILLTYSSHVLAPFIGWHLRQVSGWLTPQSSPDGNDWILCLIKYWSVNWT